MALFYLILLQLIPEEVVCLFLFTSFLPVKYSDWLLPELKKNEVTLD
jgi:hypothetical protein